MSESEQQVAQTGSHLMINPFGAAMLYYNGKEMIDSSDPTRYPIGTVDFKFLIRVNTNGSFDIQRKDGVNFNVNIETDRRVCQVRVINDELILPPWYTLFGDRLVQSFSLRPIEFKEAQFRVVLLNSGMFRRVDLKFTRSSWATMILYEHQLLKVGLQGDREMAMWEKACKEIYEQAREVAETDEEPIKFGLTQEHVRRPRTDSVSTIASVGEPSRYTNPTCAE